MSDKPVQLGPPPRHHMAVMIWLAVFPTITVLQLLLGQVIGDAPLVVRSLIMVTIAVPIVIYGLMPILQRLRVRLLTRR